jgi:hypothetical protein
MSELIPVEGKIGLFRDPQSNAIVNKNKVEYQSYIERKKITESKEKKIENVQSDVSSLKDEVNKVKDDLNEIKNLLQCLVNQNK